MYTLCIGEILWDRFPNKKVWGGAPANFIFHTAQMGANATAYSAVGDDALGKELSEAIQACGINLIAPVVEQATGVVDISLNPDGSANYKFNDDCSWDHIPQSTELLTLSRQADLIAFGSLAQRHPVSRETIFAALANKKESAKVLFDINLRQNFYTKEIIENSISHCDFLKLNEEELSIIEKLTGLSLEQIIVKYDLELVLFTLGEEGSRIITGGKTYTQAASPTQLVDTVGAGDSFTASFVINYMNGVPVEEAQKIASDVSAFVCSHSGATVELPDQYKLAVNN